MRYCRRLFWSEGLEKKKETIIRRLNENRLQWDLFVVTLPEGEKNQLEIYNTVQFLQPDVYKRQVLGRFVWICRNLPLLVLPPEREC